jgi:hypothetical protein
MAGFRVDGGTRRLIVPALNCTAATYSSEASGKVIAMELRTNQSNAFSFQEVDSVLLLKSEGHRVVIIKKYFSA